MRRWRVIPILLMCGALAAGCSSGSTQADPKATPTTTAPAEPIGLAKPLNHVVAFALSATLLSNVKVMMTSTVHGDGQPAKVTTDGLYDMRHHIGELDISISDGPVRSAHEIFQPQEIYFTTGDATRGPWSNVHRTDVQSVHLLRPPANDPAYFLVQARSIVDVTKKGVESINGQDNVTHYTGVLRPVAMLLGSTSTKRDHLRSILDAMPDSLTQVDVWIDEHERVVRVTETISAKSAGYSGTATIDVSAYGIEVKPPTPKKSTRVKIDAVPVNLLR
ncbi:MAG TPA: hypothetical protein VIR27_18210 [Mycobacteriales bacterium]